MSLGCLVDFGLGLGVLLRVSWLGLVVLVCFGVCL